MTTLRFDYTWNDLPLEVEAEFDNDNFCESIEVTSNEVEIDTDEMYNLSSTVGFKVNEHGKIVNVDGTFKGMEPVTGRYMISNRQGKEVVLEVESLYDILVEVANQKWHEGER